MLYLNEKDIEGLITMPEVMEAVDKCFKLQGRGQAPNQPRRRIFMPKGTLHAMSGGLVDGSEAYLGVKAYTTFPGLGTRFIFILWDANTAELLSFMEANIEGQLRTGAASGVAAKYMAREDASEAGLFGTGWQARTQLEALCCARPLKKVKVYSRNAEKRDKFVAAMQPRVKAQLVAAGSPAEAVKGSQIVCTMTNAKDPVFDGKDLDPGTTVIAAGSNRGTNREVDDETFRMAARGRIATDNIEGSHFESGDLIAAVRANVIQWGQVAEFGLIASGQMPGRASRDEVNLFLSQGVAIEDVALGAELYRRAKARGVGTRLPIEGVFKKAT